MSEQPTKNITTIEPDQVDHAGWDRVAQEMHTWHPDLQKHAKKHLAIRGLLSSTVAEQSVTHDGDSAPDSDEIKFDTTEAARHAEQKEAASTRRKQEFRHHIPVTDYDQQRKAREEAEGKHHSSRKALEEKTRRHDVVEAELRQEYGDDSQEVFFDRREKQEARQAIEHFDRLLGFLGESKRSNHEVLDAYEAITDAKAKLRYFHTASFADKITLLCSDEFEYANYDNFINALQFQQDFIDGRATAWKQERKDGKYVDVLHVLDPSEANPHDIQLGLKRASLRSAMIGTPEYGAYKMALQIRNSNEDEYSRNPRDDFPKTKGYHSGITEDSIGDWETIIDQYQKHAEKFARRHPDLTDEEMEYGAVRSTARLYAKSMEYQRDRGQQSPYVSTFEESLAWAQLGERVQAQLRGMRQKIKGIDLHRIERFIGKSGTSEKLQSYRREAYFLGKDIEVAKLGGTDAAELLERENTFALEKQGHWKDRELLRLEYKWTREIGKTRSEERRARYQQEWDDAVQQVYDSYNSGVTHYTDRDIDTFIQDMESRLTLVDGRIEKRKSIAEKAIDLHFALSNGREEWDDNTNSMVYNGASEYGQIIDWINDAPLGTIKRAHQRLRSGMSPDEVCKSAISEVLTRVTGVESSAEVQAMFANFADNKYEMQRMMQLAGTLGSYDVTLSFDEFKSMSAKDTRWMRESLEVFEFDDVRQFIDNGLNLSLVPKISKIASEFGYDLDTAGLIDFAKHGVINAYYYKDVEVVLSTSLRHFTIEEVEQAMSEGIDLKVLNALKPYLLAQGVSDFSELSATARRITEHSGGVNQGEHLLSRYKVAVENIGLDRANDLLNMNADIDMFNMVSREFRVQTGSDYQKTLDLVEKVNRVATNGTERELPAIRAMKQRYSNNQILSIYDRRVSAETFVDVFGADGGAIEGKTLSFDMQVDIISHAVRNTWYIRDAIKHFDTSILTELVDKGTDVMRAYDIAKQLERNEKYKPFNTTENIIYLAANNLSVETFDRTMEAGFSIDEIKKYPFLASSLLKLSPSNTSNGSNTEELADWEKELLGVTS